MNYLRDTLSYENSYHWALEMQHISWWSPSGTLLIPHPHPYPCSNISIHFYYIWTNSQTSHNVLNISNFIYMTKYSTNTSVTCFSQSTWCFWDLYILTHVGKSSSGSFNKWVNIYKELRIEPGLWCYLSFQVSLINKN